MPTLIVHQLGRTAVGVLAGPVLIGRVRACGVVIDSNDVSRVHAWVGRDADGAYFVADTFSRKGTRLNGELVTTRRRLNHGDEIDVGAARLVFQSDDTIPAGTEVLDLASKRWTGDAPDVPIHFLCTCGQTIAVSRFFAGRQASCAYCEAKLVIPRGSGQVAGTVRDIGPARSDCSICQCAIASSDAQTACPDCGLSFHNDCWVENKGCSAYGCAQVNVLALQESEPASQDVKDSSDNASEPARGPWRPALFGAGAVCVTVLATVYYFVFVR